MWGSLTTLDTLATTQQSVVAYGEDNAWAAVNAALAAHNRIAQELMGSFAQVTEDRQRRYGGLDTMTMQELDEMAMPDTQKVSAGVTVGFPLRRYGNSLQWTRHFVQNMTLGELDAQVTAMRTADLQVIQREIKRALFYPTNYAFEDRLVDHVTLAVKRLVNADSAVLPIGPNGEVFTAASHTHYLGTASFVAADLTALIEHVVEHFNGGRPMVYLNRAQETAVRGFTGFTPYLDARLVGANTATQANGNLDPTDLYNRAIGIFGPAEVWVKPWVPASYVFSFLEDVPVPVVIRRRNGGSGTLELEYEDEVHPLRARSYFREFGAGVWTRTNGAVLYTANATYAAPTLP
jgi:hypothetical protein